MKTPTALEYHPIKSSSLSMYKERDENWGISKEEIKQEQEQFKKYREKKNTAVKSEGQL